MFVVANRNYTESIVCNWVKRITGVPLGEKMEHGVAWVGGGGDLLVVVSM
jgi:hypothetical protein